MPKGNGNLTKAYSRRVRLGQVSGKNRTCGEYTDNYYQGVCGFAHTPPSLLTLCALPRLDRETRAVTGNALPRLKRQAGVSGHTLGARLHGPQCNARQLRHAMRPDRALHDVREIHHLVSNVHHHRGRWASKPATGARCHRDSRALIVGGRGGRRRAMTSHRRNT